MQAFLTARANGMAPHLYNTGKRQMITSLLDYRSTLGETPSRPVRNCEHKPCCYTTFCREGNCARDRCSPPTTPCREKVIDMANASSSEVGRRNGTTTTLSGIIMAPIAIDQHTQTHQAVDCSPTLSKTRKCSNVIGGCDPLSSFFTVKNSQRFSSPPG